MNRKLAALALISVFLVATASASSFGSFSSENEKEIDSLETGFTISVFNLGNETLELEINSTEPEGAAIVHENNIQLEPSEITRNPSGDKTWFLTSNNRYVETTQIPVKFFRESDTSRNNFEFSVTLHASTSMEEGEAGVVQNIVQVRNYNYQVETDFQNTDSSGSDGNQDNSEDTDQTSDNSTSIIDDVSDAISGIGGGNQNQEQQSSDQETAEGDDETGGEELDGQNAGESSDETSEELADNDDSLTGQFLQSASVNSVTVLMFAFLAGSLIYFMKVI